MLNSLELSTLRVLALRDAGVLRDAFGVRVFAALGRCANLVINPQNQYAEEQRSIGKQLFETHQRHVALAEAIAASILSEPNAPIIEALEDEALQEFIVVFVRRYFGLADVPDEG